MSNPKPSTGRIVTYVLSSNDAKAINERANANASIAGDECAALIVRVFTDDCVNLQVFYDGEGSLWSTSRVRGEGLGQWNWPARV